MKLLRHIKNPTPSINAYLLEGQSCKTACLSSLKRRVLGFFEESRPNSEMSSNMGSVPDQKLGKLSTELKFIETQ